MGAPAAAIVTRNEGLALARWQLSRGEFAIKRDDIIYRRINSSSSREKEAADARLPGDERDEGEREKVQSTRRGPPPCVNLLIKPVSRHHPLVGSGSYAHHVIDNKYNPSRFIVTGVDYSSSTTLRRCVSTATDTRTWCDDAHPCNMHR